MHWSKEAEEEISKVPFFVRKRVRKKVEDEAGRCGDRRVRLEHVRTCQNRFMRTMEGEVKGYQVETCFGPGGCPNRAVAHDDLSGKLGKKLASKSIKAFLQERVEGPLKFHHEFRVSISDCPNACSRPQIVDVGLIGARRPRVSTEECTRCAACVEVCREGAVRLSDRDQAPIISKYKCVSCGQCLSICPTGTIQEDAAGYRILVGGKLGRHPQLGKELPGIYTPDETIAVFERCVDHYLKHNVEGERLGEIVNRTGVHALTEHGPHRSK